MNSFEMCLEIFYSTKGFITPCTLVRLCSVMNSRDMYLIIISLRQDRTKRITERERERQTDKQTDRQTDRQTDKNAKTGLSDFLPLKKRSNFKIMISKGLTYVLEIVIFYCSGYPHYQGVVP